MDGFVALGQISVRAQVVARRTALSLSLSSSTSVGRRPRPSGPISQESKGGPQSLPLAVAVVLIFARCLEEFGEGGRRRSPGLKLH